MNKEIFEEFKKVVENEMEKSNDNYIDSSFNYRLTIEGYLKLSKICYKAGDEDQIILLSIRDLLQVALYLSISGECEEVKKEVLEKISYEAGIEKDEK